MDVAPDRRISSLVITWTAAADSETRCGFLDTEVTFTFMSCSRESSVRSRWFCAALNGPEFDIRKRPERAAVAHINRCHGQAIENCGNRSA